MLGVIECDYCGLIGTFPVELKIQYRSERCGTCQHVAGSAYTYYFCATPCLSAWMTERTINGLMFLKCRNCHGTGNAFGFKENGACNNCEGQGGIEVPHSNNETNTARLKQMEAESAAANRARRTR